MIKLTIRSSSNLSLFFLYSSQVAHKMESAPNAAIFNPIRFCILFWSNFELSKLFSSVSFITNKLPRAQSFHGFQNWPIEIPKDQGSPGQVMVSEIHSERKLFGAYFIKAIKYNSKLLGRIDTFVELGIHCFWNIFYHLIKYFQKSKVGIRYENSIENNKCDVNMTIFGFESLFWPWKYIWPWPRMICNSAFIVFDTWCSPFSCIIRKQHAVHLKIHYYIVQHVTRSHGRRLSDKPGKLTKMKLGRLFHFRSWSSFGVAWPFQ